MITLTRLFVLIATFVLTSACTSMPESPLIGRVTKQQVLAMPGFSASYHQFQPTDAELNTIRQLEGHRLLVIFGQWCHDSEREVPRLLKLLQLAEVPLDELTFVAVDQHKQDREGIAAAMNLRYTPTFYLYRQDTLLGSVVEKPKQNLAVDLASLTQQ